MEDKETDALMGYCGLYCGDCLNYKGEIADMARDLRKKLRESKFDRVSAGLSKYVKELNNYEQCYEVLGGMVRLRCKRGCRNGGGNPGCKIRNCCIKKGIEGCWECGDVEDCSKHDFLKTIHEDACIKNLKKIKTAGVDGFIDGKRYW